MSKVVPLVRRIFGIRNFPSSNVTVVVEEDEEVRANEMKAISRPSDIYENNMTFKLWSRVHSKGQGYIKCCPVSKNMASSGTSVDAAVLQFKQGGDDGYRISFKSGTETYYLCCDGDAVMATEDVAKSTTFRIVPMSNNCGKITRYYQIKFNSSGKTKMLKVGEDDGLITTLLDKEKIDKIDGRTVPQLMQIMEKLDA